MPTETRGRRHRRLPNARPTENRRRLVARALPDNASSSDGRRRGVQGEVGAGDKMAAQAEHGAATRSKKRRVKGREHVLRDQDALILGLEQLDG
jgi:hypothetical protein